MDDRMLRRGEYRYPRRHELGFWTLDDPHDPRARAHPGYFPSEQPYDPEFEILAYWDRHPRYDGPAPRRHRFFGFWTLDDPNDPRARFCPPDLVPVFGDGIHDGEGVDADDNAASIYLSYRERHPEGPLPRRHMNGFWTLDDANDPNAKPVTPGLVPVPGDGVHDGEEDNFPYARPI